MQNKWPEAVEGRIVTKNEMGFMFLEINGASPAFIEDSKKSTGWVADLGCAYGIATLPVLKHATCNVIAFDLAQEHLDILHSSVPAADATKLTTIQGRFPDDFKVDDNSLDAIHSSFMWHFLTGADTEKGLDKCFKALKPGGKIYINLASAYFVPFKGALDLYKKNVAQGVKYPGELHEFKSHVPEQDVPYVPNFLNVHTIDDLEPLIKQHGFNVEKIFYYDMHEPEWFASGGRGCIGVIASKAK